METAQRPDSNNDDEEKLIPEWGLSADNQVILAGLAILLALLAFFGWQAFRDGDDDVATVASSIVASPTIPGATGDDAGTGDPIVAQAEDAGDAAASEATDDEAAATTAPTTTAAPAGPGTGDLQGALDALPGAITGTLDGSTALLTGFVANQGESDEAEDAATAIDGVDDVDNQLVLLEPQVEEELLALGVITESANGLGTEIIVGGTLQSEADREPTLDAVRAIDGVTAVEDRLEVSVAADLNQLPQVQFATASDEILPVSFADLDQAAELIQSAGEVQLLVVGWTDVQGGAQANLELSQRRAESVVAYLTEAGVSGALLAAVGNGETDQFAEGNSPEALQANRVVLFEQTS